MGEELTSATAKILNDTTPFPNASDAFHVPAAFPEILRDLNREILRNQPADIYAFCAQYFKLKVSQAAEGKVK